MSLNAVLANAYSGISTNQTALRVTSNNVANVNTDGYARQEARITSNLAGGRGAGVRVEEIERVVNQFLEVAESDALSGAEEATVVREFHDRVQSLLGRPDSETSLTAKLDDSLAAMTKISLDPSDSLRRKELLFELEGFLSELSRLSNDIQSLRVEASNQMTEDVSAINAKLKEIHDLNPRIVQAELGTGETAGLKDRRDRAIRDLSEIIDIRTSTTATGAVHIATADGVALLDDARRVFSYSSPGSGDPFTEFSQITMERLDTSTGLLDGREVAMDHSIGSGRLKGLFNVRDKELPDIAASLGELARVFSDSINRVHNESASRPAQNSLSGRETGLLATDLAHLTGTADFAVVDPDGVLVAKATIDFTALGPTTTMADVIAAINTGLGGAGTASLSPEGALQISATAAANGVVVAGDTANPASRAGRGFAHFFGLNDLVASDQPTHFDTGFIGTDAHGFTAGQTIEFEVRSDEGRTLRLVNYTIAGTDFDDILNDLNDPLGLGGYFTFGLDADGALTATANAGFGKIDLISLADTTERGSTGLSFTELFGLRRGTQSAHAVDVSVNQRISNDPEYLSLGEFDQSALVGDTALTVGDGRGAARLADLQLELTQFGSAGNIEPLETTITQYAAFVMGNTAVMAQSASAEEDNARALQTSVSQKRADVSGVNIDEELAQMVVFQNAYNASARMISTVQQMFDELLSVV